MRAVALRRSAFNSRRDGRTMKTKTVGFTREGAADDVGGAACLVDGVSAENQKTNKKIHEREIRVEVSMPSEYKYIID